jgi:hypothetical protein
MKLGTGDFRFWLVGIASENVCHLVDLLHRAWMDLSRQKEDLHGKDGGIRLPVQWKIRQSPRFDAPTVMEKEILPRDGNTVARSSFARWPILLVHDMHRLLL